MAHSAGSSFGPYLVRSTGIAVLGAGLVFAGISQSGPMGAAPVMSLPTAPETIVPDLRRSDASPLHPETEPTPLLQDTGSDQDLPSAPALPVTDKSLTPDADSPDDIASSPEGTDTAPDTMATIAPVAETEPLPPASNDPGSPVTGIQPSDTPLTESAPPAPDNPPERWLAFAQDHAPRLRPQPQFVPVVAVAPGEGDQPASDGSGPETPDTAQAGAEPLSVADIATLLDEELGAPPLDAPTSDTVSTAPEAGSASATEEGDAVPEPAASTPADTPDSPDAD